MNSSGRVPMTEFDRSGARLAFLRPPLNMSAGHRSGSDHGEPRAGGRPHVERGSVARIRSCYCRNAVDHVVVAGSHRAVCVTRCRSGTGRQIPSDRRLCGWVSRRAWPARLRAAPLSHGTKRQRPRGSRLDLHRRGCGALSVVAAGLLPRPNRDHVAEAGDRADAPGTVRVVAQSAVCRLRLRFTSGAALVTNTVWPLLLLAPVLAVVIHAVINREERYLQRMFGSAYEEYCRDVGRWL